MPGRQRVVSDRMDFGVSDDPCWDAFYEALQELHLKSGPVSSRVISTRSGGAVSHTTVIDIVTGRRLAGWRATWSVVCALGGDTATFRQLHTAAWRELHDLDAGPPSRPTRNVRLEDLLSELVAIRALLEKAIGG